MKLRIRGNSVRLRLTGSEVARFSETGKVEEVVEFGFEPNQQFFYSLEKTAGDKVVASFSGNRLSVFLPRDEAEAWANSDQISIEAAQPAGAGDKRLRILIEKDFACAGGWPARDDSESLSFTENQKKVC